MGVLLPSPTAQRLRDEAARRWGPRAIEPDDGPEVWVRVWRQSPVGEPFGGVLVRWNEPTPATSVVVEVGWHANRGGTDGDVLDLLNRMMGWPLLR